MFVYKPDQARVPIAVWMDEQEYWSDHDMTKQITNAASLPFVVGSVCLMPDGHAGFGVPIGTVVKTKGAYCPEIVGVDIACGVCALPTGIESIAQEDIRIIMGTVRESIPVGFDRQKEPCDLTLMPKIDHSDIVDKEFDKARYQMGTLGGGECGCHRAS